MHPVVRKVTHPSACLCIEVYCFFFKVRSLFVLTCGAFLYLLLPQQYDMFEDLMLVKPISALSETGDSLRGKIGTCCVDVTDLLRTSVG